MGFRLRSPATPMSRDEFVDAAWVAAFFLVLTSVALAWHPPSAAQKASADPLVRLADGLGGLWLAPSLCAIGVGPWILWGHVRHRASTIAAHASAGAASATALLLALRLGLGSRLPAFFPPEEGAAPGLPLSLEAGLLEEVLFRLVVLPAVYSAARLWAGPARSAAISILSTGLAFALSHELEPDPRGLQPLHFATRLLGPGCLMTAGCFVVSPAFVVAAHGTAHLLLPVLFA